MESRSFNWNIIESDGNVVNTCVFRLVGNIVCSIAIVNNICFNWSVGALYINYEIIPSFFSSVSVLVTCFDGEISRMSVEVAWFKTRTISNTIGGVRSRIDLNVNRRVLKMIIEDRLIGFL